MRTEYITPELWVADISAEKRFLVASDGKADTQFFEDWIIENEMDY